MNDTILSQLKREYNIKKILCQCPSDKDKEDLKDLREQINSYSNLKNSL